MKLFFDRWNLVVVVVVCLEPAACRVLLFSCSVKAKPKTLKGVGLSEAVRRGHSQKNKFSFNTTHAVKHTSWTNCLMVRQVIKESQCSHIFGLVFGSCCIKRQENLLAFLWSSFPALEACCGFLYFIDVFMLYWCILLVLEVFFFSLHLKDILLVLERFFSPLFYWKYILASVLEWLVKITKEIVFLARVKHTVFVSAAQCICFIGTSSICKTKCTIMFCICKPHWVFFVNRRAQVNQMFFVCEVSEETYLHRCSSPPLQTTDLFSSVCRVMKWKGL